MLEFCLSLNHGMWKGENGPHEEVFDISRLADDFQFDSVWVTEDPDGWDAFALLGAISQQTSRLRLGPGVTNPYMRHPNLIAASVSTVDQLSLGRAFVCLGRGQPEVFQTTFGMPKDHPLQRLEESISLLRQWFHTPFRADGEEPVPVHDWQRTIGPVGSPPIYLAATGPKALALAGRKADGVLFNSLATPKFLEWAIDIVRSSAVEAGRDPEALVFFANPELTLTDDTDLVLEKRKSTAILIHALPGMDRQLMSDEWDVPAIIECVRQAMKTREILAQGGHFPEMLAQGDRKQAKACLPAGLIRQASITGDEAYALQQLQMYESIGITHVFANQAMLSNQTGRFREFLDAYRDPAKTAE